MQESCSNLFLKIFFHKINYCLIIIEELGENI